MSKRKRRPPGSGTGVPVLDAFSNPLYRLGYGSQSPLEATQYHSTRMSDNYALLNTLYRENWLVQNVVGTMPDDMLRAWYKLRGADADAVRALRAAERRTGLRSRLAEGLRWGRLYGGAVGLLLIRGHEGRMDTPLDLDSVLPGSFCGLLILDRWSGVQPSSRLVSDPTDPDFGLPDSYDICDAQRELAARVHHSRVLRFEGRDLPYQERAAAQFWGESEVEALYRDVVAHDNVSANIAGLTFRANVDTMEVQNLDQLFAIGSRQAQQRFWSTMQAQSVLRSNFGMQLVEKGNRLTNTQYSFTGLAEVFDVMCYNLCAASHYPMTKLFGRSPGGLNATGESDLRNYYDYVDGLRESQLRPLLERLLPVLAMSTWGCVPDTEILFPSLWTPTRTELADIAARNTDTVVKAFQAGLLQADTAQRELKKLAEDTGLFGSISDAEIAANAGRSYQDVTALRDPLAGLTS